MDRSVNKHILTKDNLFALLPNHVHTHREILAFPFQLDRQSLVPIQSYTPRIILNNEIQMFWQIAFHEIVNSPTDLAI